MLSIRSAFDDTDTKEHEIEIVTKQITRSFQKCQSSIKQIGIKARNCSTQQQKMAANIMSSLAQKLQVIIPRVVLIARVILMSRVLLPRVLLVSRVTLPRVLLVTRA